MQPASLRLAVSHGAGARPVGLFTKTAKLPAGMVSDGFDTLNIHDRDGLLEILRGFVRDPAIHTARRTALSLPDGVFRVQVLDFDRLPRLSADLNRLVRWRLEKTAAFTASDVALRYQIFKRRDSGFTVVACAARADVLSQYEALVLALGLEPWTVGISSFNAFNFYFPYIAAKSPLYAFTHVRWDSFAMLILEREVPRFYRYKEIKKCPVDETAERLLSELEDSLHFYTHIGRQQTTEVGHLYISGDSDVLGSLARGLGNATLPTVEILSPDRVLGSGLDMTPGLAAALGAGSAL